MTRQDVFEKNILLEELPDVFEHGVSIVPSQIRDMVNKRNTGGWWHYVKSKCFFEYAVKELGTAASAATPPPPRRAFIIGSMAHSYHGTTNEVSLAYLRLVRQFFVARGYEVSTRLDGTPDDDMVWMSRASSFVASGGGFSRIAADCVRRRGGRAVVGDGPCLTVPRPNITAKEYSWEQQGWQGKESWSGLKNYPPEETVWK